MRITKLFSQMICCGAFSSVSVLVLAQEPLTHDHLREHGGQVYQATKIDTGWTQNEEGEGRFSSELESWVGTDEINYSSKPMLKKPSRQMPIMAVQYFIAEISPTIGMCRLG